MRDGSRSHTAEGVVVSRGNRNLTPDIVVVSRGVRNLTPDEVTIARGDRNLLAEGVISLPEPFERSRMVSFPYPATFYASGQMRWWRFRGPWAGNRIREQKTSSASS